MSYQALYRVWRPDTFSDVVGQQAIVTTLTSQVLSGRVAHAYLFCGSRGTGKTSTAKVFARAINCLQPRENGDPCGECEACEALSRENNMDVIEIDAASNNGVDEIRELRDKIKYPPSIGRYKVYIIDEVHMLSSGAFNALLKTLEEPPSHAVFILATTEPQKLPATVLSRCQRYDFKRIAARVIVERMQRVLDSMGREAEPEALSEIARAAEGGMRDALSLLDMCLAYGDGPLTAGLVRDVLGASDRGSLFALAGHMLSGDAGAALRLIDRQMQSGRDAQVFARDVASHMRALMVAQFAGDGLGDLLELTEEDAQRLRAQAEGVPTGKLMRLMDLFMHAENEMRWASKPRAVLELCAVRACHPEREAGIEALVERVADLEKKLAAGVVSPAPAGIAPGGPQSDPSDPVPPPEELDAPPFDMPAAPAGAAAPGGPPPKAAPSPKPAAARAASAASDPNWAKALELIRKANPALYQPASQLKCMGVDGDTAVLQMPKKWNMFLAVLQQDQKKQVLEQQLSEAFGRPMHAQLSLEDASALPRTQAAAPRQHTLETAYDLFGRENVSVLDDE